MAVRLRALVSGGIAACGSFGGSCYADTKKDYVIPKKTTYGCFESTISEQVKAGLGPGDHGEWGLGDFDRTWDTEHLERDDQLGTTASDKVLESSSAVRSLILIRHGEYTMSTGELTELGMEQAELSAKRVKSLCEGKSLVEHPTSLVVSSATRAMQTSEPFIKELGLEPEIDDQIREAYPCLGNDRPNRRTAEKLEAEHDKLETAFKRLFRRPTNSTKNEVVVVVCHANVIRYWTLRALQLPPELWTSLSLPHGSVTHVRISARGSVCVRCIGDAGFLPPDKLTTVAIES